MTSKLQNKPFLDYSSQVNYLIQKGLEINDSVKAINILEKTSYYGLVNGYKDVFKDPATNHYITGTTFEDIYNLYLFDADLRDAFLKYILLFEKNIKSSISYHFTQLYGNGSACYQDFNNYDYGSHQKDISYLFRKMNDKINGRHRSPQVAHYMRTYHDVPLWVLTTDLTLGETASMYRFLKGRCKTNVCNDFRGIGSLYQCGKSDLFSAVICLKYLLSPEDFHDFYYALKKILKKYNPSDDTMSLMGFPNNWMSILRIKI